ncbi:MAG TPA: Rieske (2Fe-2S) protein [Pyrinomonadaceae bacterium]|jgi:Rieske Fe-S protein|nr:Rieske (2Fe-2S) protein [Pyrinomonadaceae bacterium]
MAEKDINSAEHKTERRQTSQLRRRIIIWIPAAVIASAAGTVFAAAFKFLRPRAGEVGLSGGASGNWHPVAKVSELLTDEPLRREVPVEHRAGWSSTLRAQAVFVLPGGERRVVSAVCPHEGCAVDWSGEQRKFLCPCHDSVFGPDGARLSGPAQRGLDPLPARVNGDTLEAQFADAQTQQTQADTPTKA